jgi:hypothetical protein
VIDGEVDGGGGPRSAAPERYQHIEGKIGPRLEKPAGADISLRASKEGKTVWARAGVSNVNNGSSDLALHILLVEKLVRYSGENGIRFHPMVVRSKVLAPLEGAREINHEHSFDLEQVEKDLKDHLDEFEKYNARHNQDGKFRFMERKDTIDPGNLAVAVFVQDTKTKEVLQSAFAEF